MAAYLTIFPYQKMQFIQKICRELVESFCVCGWDRPRQYISKEFCHVIFITPSAMEILKMMAETIFVSLNIFLVCLTYFVLLQIPVGKWIA